MTIDTRYENCKTLIILLTLETFLLLAALIYFISTTRACP